MTLQEISLFGFGCQKIVGFGRVFNKVVQFRSCVLDIFVPVSYYTPQGMGIILCWDEALAEQVTRPIGKCLAAKTSGQIHSMDIWRGLYSKQTANGWNNINQTDPFGYDFGFTFSGQFKNQRNSYVALINEIAVGWFFVLA